MLLLTKSMNGNLQQSNKTRPPVVVVLGHVDHGKTKLLDVIRNTNLVDKEAGGITQHIGAYQINFNNRSITFLDTPGHEAFTAIRSRGVKVADLAVLVVAADESVKPQTREAIKIIKAENLPFLVAINKIDKEGANPTKVKQDLAAEDVLVENWGGKIPVVEISAKTGQNISELLEMILLLADIEELKEDLSIPAEGVIIETYLNKKCGYMATALIQKGILRLGDWIVVGKVWGKVKSMHDYNGKPIKEARPSQPVVITGWNEAPETGVNFVTAYSKKELDEIIENNSSINLAPLFEFFKESPEDETKKMYNLILKADVRGSLEAINVALKAINSDYVKCRVISYDISDITENDVKTAIATKSDIVGFRVNILPSAARLADKEKIKIQVFDIIYDLVESIRENMTNLLETQISKILIGKLKVLAFFKKSAKSQIFGGKVIFGRISRGKMGDVIRGDSIIASGKIGQIQRNKEDVDEVKENFEAGIRLDFIFDKPFNDVMVGDILEAYEEEKIERTL
jgi:translation initiation factor IF-2